MALRRMIRRSLLAAALAAGALTAGCGFHPLYAEPGVVENLRDIQVVTPDTREGRILKERLDDALGATGRADWVLTTTISELRSGIGARADDSATRYELAWIVGWTLSRGSSQAAAGSVTATVTYAASDQPYAGLIARQDGQDRAAALAADMIRSELATRFADGTLAPAQP
ncbi:hypothetical protein Q0812_06560 [Brevundimonas sp. 2R-24]|uniref:Lipoprotein n=1 Tax=Peiella sedimenti TaxID=3061083 RepID=A0ABT8SNA3_9CAUL|nr:hypothetical protein [Caulobacteraceae bacterium XZ-24]